MSKPKYSWAVGQKFNADRSAKRFPGNTIICHIPKQSPQFNFLVELREDMMKQPWAKKYSWLPPSSFHMTVHEGICEYVRKATHWPKELSREATLQEADEFFIEKFKEISVPEPFEIKAKGIGFGGVITMGIEPATEEMEKRMRTYRDEVAEKLTLKFPGHSFYGFHISFAYSIEILTFRERMQVNKYKKKISERAVKEFGVLKLNDPELTFFEDMTNFADSRANARQNVQE